jgi:hypothetical protein
MTMVMLKQYFYSQTKRTKQITAVLVVLIVAAVGTYLLVGSHAATPYASITADKGTLANGATSQSCTGASDGNCVMFGNSNPSVIFGVDGSGGSGAGLAAIFTNGGIKWDRIDYVMPTTTPLYETPTQDAGYGISAFGIIMTPTSNGAQEPLSDTTPAAYAAYGYSVIKSASGSDPSMTLWEAGNEQYFYGTAQQYGAQYLALYNAINGITAGYTKIPGITLMFDMWGDYELPSGQWSSDASPNILGYSGGGGWLADAVDTNSGLKNDIQALSSHPYGGLSVADDYCGASGTQGAVTPYALAGVPSGYSGPKTNCPMNTTYCPANGCSIEAMAQEYLGHTPSIYITEYGIQTTDVGTSSASASDAGFDTSCSTQQGAQAYLLTEAYNIWATDPHIAGIFWYQAEDYGSTNGLFDSTAQTTSPAFDALVQAENLKQNTPSCNG